MNSKWSSVGSSPVPQGDEGPLRARSGRLTQCRALMGMPAGVGFGEATAEVAERYMRAETVDRDGELIVGRAIWFPMVWQLGK